MVNNSLAMVRGGVIVSVQAEEDEPFYTDEPFLAMVSSVLTGGACGLRLSGSRHIQLVKTHFPNIPVVGIAKPAKIPLNFQHHVYITPTCADGCLVAESGADIIAFDATRRERPHGETLKTLVEGLRKRFPDCLLMGDIATVSEGLHAVDLGVDVLATTLSGYTGDTWNKIPNGPDFDLLEAMIARISSPVILEGRVESPEDVRQAFESGAHAVVIGSAITRPHLITRRFVAASSKHMDNGVT